MKRKLPPMCRPASKVTITLTVGQEKVILKSHIYAIVGESVQKAVRHMVQSAIIDEAARQGKDRA